MESGRYENEKRPLFIVNRDEEGQLRLYFRRLYILQKEIGCFCAAADRTSVCLVPRMERAPAFFAVPPVNLQCFMVRIVKAVNNHDTSCLANILTEMAARAKPFIDNQLILFQRKARFFRVDLFFVIFCWLQQYQSYSYKSNLV